MKTQPKKNQTPVCPKDGSNLRYYDGALGYESMVCPKCNYDMNDNETNAELVQLIPVLLEAAKQLLSRLELHGSIDSIREEGPI